MSAHALFLDLDGTLTPIVERPELARISDQLEALLTHLTSAMGGAVALVTGRTVADADRILGGILPHIAGVHGNEIRCAADVLHDDIDFASVAAARDEARALLATAPDARIEDKTASIALHFRLAPHLAPQVRKVAEAMADKHGLRIQEGKMVIELLAGAKTKAHALEAFLSAAPFAGRIPVAVGDDATDEHAFAAACQHGGFSVLVGEPRRSAAQYFLRDPAAVADWLAAALARETTP